jgi:hypothetical protein
METAAGVLLLYRRTVTLGLFVAAGAFANVVMINMSYDVPVKLFASHLLLSCIFLLAWDAKRLFAFLVLNRPAGGTSLYEPYFAGKWRRWTALGLKLVFVYFILVVPFRGGLDRYRRLASTPEPRPFAVGPWEVRTHVVAGDTLDPAAPDSPRWRDVIFDNAGSGSIGTTDSMFWQRYRRGYFRFSADTLARTATFWRTSVVFDSTYLFTSRWEMPDSQTIRMWTAIAGDSVYLELARSDRHYQLTERQFHWLSEYNR